MPVGIWVALILTLLFILIGGHLVITKIYPHLRNLLKLILKDDNATNPIMALLIIIVMIIVASKLIAQLLSLNNVYLNIFGVLDPSVAVLKEIIPYIIYLLVGIIITLGIKKR